MKTNNWQIKSLGEVAEFISTGKTPSTTIDEYFGGDIQWFTPSDIGAAKYLENSQRTLTKKSISEKKAILFPANTLLITCIGNIGRVGILKSNSSSNQQITGIKFIESLDVDYAYYWFKKNIHKLAGKANQAVVPILNNAQLREIKIEFPPLPIQKQIAEILEQADKAKQKRKEANKLTDEFLRSVFIEMFGDPVNNPKGFKVVTIGDVITEVKDGPHVSPNYVKNGIPILSTRNVRPGLLLLDDMKYVSEEHYSYLTRNFKPRKGDVLLTKGGTTGYAKAVDFEWPFCVWVHIAVLRPKNIINPQYLESALNSNYCYQQSQLYTHGIANHDLGLTRLIKIKLLLPPYKLQQQFTEIVNKTEALKEKQKQSEQELENLFQSLMQKAFKGELVS